MINREGLDIAAKNRTPQRRAIGVVGVSHVSSREGESFASPDEEGQTVAEATRGGRFSRREPPGGGEYRSLGAPKRPNSPGSGMYLFSPRGQKASHAQESSAWTKG